MMTEQMTFQIPALEMQTVIHLQPLDSERLSDDEFERLVQNNGDMRVEQTQAGEIIIMPPTGGTTSKRNSSLTGQLHVWNSNADLGEVFESSVIFVLPGGAKRSPDASWIKKERWNKLTRAQQDIFPPICPDLVVELRSKTDVLKTLQSKMQEYIENGAQLGWLIDPTKRKVHVYRPNIEVEILDQPEVVSGEPLLPKFTLKLTDFWI